MYKNNILRKTNTLTHAHKTDSARTGSAASKALLKQTWKSAEGEYGATQAADSCLVWAGSCPVFNKRNFAFHVSVS